MHFLSPNSVFGRWMAFFLDALLISMAWFLCCLPIVTIGAATAALNKVAQNWMRSRSECTLRDFFVAFRENFKGATGVWLILLVPMCIIGFNAYAVWIALVKTSSAAQWMIGISAALWVATAVYAFALQAGFENPPLRTVTNALRLALVNLVRSAVLVAVFAIVLYATYLFPFGAVFYTPVYVFLAARPVWAVFKKVMDLQEDAQGPNMNSENEGE